MDNPQVQETMIKEEQTGDFAASSRRAASRPRRATNPVAQEIAVEDDNRRGEPALPSTEKTTTLGMLEEHLQLSPFPFGDFVSVHAIVFVKVCIFFIKCFLLNFDRKTRGKNSKVVWR